jgi:hypothetical protein
MSNKASSLAKSQGGNHANRPSRATRWPDGTPRSQGNDFTAHLDGRPSVFASAQDQALATRGASSTAAVERSRAKGIEPARISQLTRRLGRAPKASA